jgi:hypothetical protein
MKTCSCGHAHPATPAGGQKDAKGNYYFQCSGGCNSTLVVRPACCAGCERLTTNYVESEVEVDGPHPGCAEFAPPDVWLAPFCRSCRCEACGGRAEDGVVCPLCLGEAE